jgi:hypothetical protein
MSEEWARAVAGEPGFRARQRILNRLAEYFHSEYDSQVRRHAFYEDLNHGGKAVVMATQQVAEEIGKPPPKEAVAKS